MSDATLTASGTSTASPWGHCAYELYDRTYKAIASAPSPSDLRRHLSMMKHPGELTEEQKAYVEEWLERELSMIRRQSEEFIRVIDSVNVRDYLEA